MSRPVFTVELFALFTLFTAACNEQTNQGLDSLPYCSRGYVTNFNDIVMHDKYRKGYSAELLRLCQEFDQHHGFESRCLGRNLKTLEPQAVEGYVALDICRDNSKLAPRNM